MNSNLFFFHVRKKTLQDKNVEEMEKSEKNMKQRYKEQSEIIKKKAFDFSNKACLVAGPVLSYFVPIMERVGIFLARKITKKIEEKRRFSSF